MGASTVTGPRECCANVSGEAAAVRVHCGLFSCPACLSRSCCDARVVFRFAGQGLISHSARPRGDRDAR